MQEIEIKGKSNKVQWFVVRMTIKIYITLATQKCTQISDIRNEESVTTKIVFIAKR